MILDMFKNNEPSLKNSPEMLMLLKRGQVLAEEKNIEGLKDLLRTIWRRLQSRIMLNPYLLPDHEACDDVAFNFCSFNEISDCYKGQANSQISLAEPIITFPWHPDRIINNLGVIGNSRVRGKFKSSSNHSVNYYWPLMLAKVTGGNHSVAQGILMGDGEVDVKDWYNLTPLLQKYKCNGTHWINSETDKVIAYCDCPELGMAWEVSRLLIPFCSEPYESYPSN